MSARFKILKNIVKRAPPEVEKAEGYKALIDKLGLDKSDPHAYGKHVLNQEFNDVFPSKTDLYDKRALYHKIATNPM